MHGALRLYGETLYVYHLLSQLSQCFELKVHVPINIDSKGAGYIAENDFQRLPTAPKL